MWWVDRALVNKERTCTWSTALVIKINFAMTLHAHTMDKFLLEDHANRMITLSSSNLACDKISSVVQTDPMRKIMAH